MYHKKHETLNHVQFHLWLQEIQAASFSAPISNKAGMTGPIAGRWA
jgi:hypothetical protein